MGRRRCAVRTDTMAAAETEYVLLALLFLLMEGAVGEESFLFKKSTQPCRHITSLRVPHHHFLSPSQFQDFLSLTVPISLSGEF